MPLNSIDLATLSRLLDEALDLEPENAQAWLTQLPREHGHLRAKLQEMLAEHLAPRHPGFMAAGPKLDAVAESVANAGELIGPYRLIRELGRGGMGAVWLAQRSDGTLKRQVALKLPRLAWGQGLAERMARERDIGALLEHPHIARLYDAGVDEHARPYIAFEFIDGVPIDLHCAERRLTVRERLALILQVARAVAYAHGRLVIHRDIKPANVLVGADGQAHLLDFGIAKLLNDVAVQGLGLTEALGRVLTPSHASPEQIAGKAVGVTTDVYSLGVLAYELLTGSLPFTPARQTLGAMEEAILQGDAGPASGRVSDRATRQALRGDVDAMLGKAMKPRPDDRYSSAEAFADDIERHLAGEPVRAQPDSAWYRLSKALRRHRVACAAGAAVSLALVAGGTVAMVQAQRAKQQAARAQMATDFVSDVFRLNSQPTVATPTPGTRSPLPPLSSLDQSAQLIQMRFAGQADMQAELFGVVGRVYADMGANQLALNYAQRQIDALGSLPQDSARLVRALLLLAEVCAREGRDAEALGHAHKAVALADADDDLWLEAQATLAGLQIANGQVDEARKSVQIAQTRLPALGDRPTAGLALLLSAQTALATLQSNLDEANALSARAIEVALKAQGPQSRVAIDLDIDRAHQLINLNRHQQAWPHMTAALARLRSSGGPNQIRAAIAEAWFWTRLFEQHGASYADAAAAVEKSRAFLANQTTSLPPTVSAELDHDLANLRSDWGDLRDQGVLMDSSARILKDSTQSLHRRWQIVAAEAAVAIQLNRPEKADALLRERLDLRRKMGRGNTPFAAYDWAFVALNLDMQGKFDAAEKVLAAAPLAADISGVPGNAFYAMIISMIETRVRIDRGDATGAMASMQSEFAGDSDDFDALLGPNGLWGEVLCAVGRSEEGLKALFRSIQSVESTSGETNPGLARQRAVAGICALHSGKRALARELAGKARAAFTAQPDVNPYFKLPLVALEASLQPHR